MISQPLYVPAKRGFLHGLGRSGAWGTVIAAGALGCSAVAPRVGAPLAVEPGASDRVQSQERGGPPKDVGRPPALVGSAPITWEEMQPLMAEAAGGLVLEELVLDRALAVELRLRGVQTAPADVARERDMLLQAMARAAGSTPDAAADLLTTLRRSRGLGEQRFDALLRRNAGLRRLVRDEVTISEQDLETGYAVQFGPRYRARLIVAPSERVAAQALTRVRGRDEQPAEPFGEVAAELSTDSSAARGGAIEPISPADPTYPSGLRQALARLRVGEISDPIALEQGFAILRLEEILPASPRPLAEVRGEVEAELRLIRERAAMDMLASRLLASSPVIVMDRSLDWSWQGRRDPNQR